MPKYTQADLFQAHSASIKAHHLARLRELRAEFAERAKTSERKRLALERAERTESWDEIKRASHRT